jgi:hypothetical protein
MERTPSSEPGFDPAEGETSRFSVTVVQAVSKLLLAIGALIFFFGDRALRELWKVNFALGELIGIGLGVAVMFAGGAMQLALPESKRLHAKKRHG